VALTALAVLALAVVMWGGYSHRWPWTGINGGTATLWNWLHLLLLPLAVAVLPIWVRSDTRVGARTKNRGAAGLTAFVILVILGYTVPWAWTGFRGNTVWDWLQLLVLPLAVVLAPRLAEMRRIWTPRHTAVTLAGAAVFIVIVIGGYAVPWAWTGFTGNTLWNWLNLLFLPLLLPTVIVPALRPRMMRDVVYLDAEGKPLAGDAAEAAATGVKPAAPTARPTPVANAPVRPAPTPVRPPAADDGGGGADPARSAPDTAAGGWSATRRFRSRPLGRDKEL